MIVTSETIARDADPAMSVVSSVALGRRRRLQPRTSPSRRANLKLHPPSCAQGEFATKRDGSGLLNLPEIAELLNDRCRARPRALILGQHVHQILSPSRSAAFAVPPPSLPLAVGEVDAARSCRRTEPCSFVPDEIVETAQPFDVSVSVTVHALPEMTADESRDDACRALFR